MRKLSPEVRKALAELGREGGLKGGAVGGRIRAQRLSPERRKEIAKQAIKARWKKWRKTNPEKAKAKRKKRSR